MSKRIRGIALTEQGIAAVRFELSKRGWTQSFFADEACVALATITRLLRGDRLDVGTLTAALTVIGLEVDPYIQKLRRQEVTVPPQPPVESGMVPSPDKNLSFFMNATFVDTQRPQIERTLEALQILLINSEVSFHTDDDGQLTISGEFEPARKSAVEATIRHLERLLSNVIVTGDVVCDSSQ